MTHKQFMNYMRKLGYPFPVGDRGVCHGIAHMAIQAMLLGQIQLFEERIQRMASQHGDLPSKWNRTGIRKFRKKPLLSQEEIDILSFLDSVYVYQNTASCVKLFEIDSKFLSQDAILAAQLIGTLDKEHRDGLYEVDTFCGIYNELELLKMLESFRENVIETPGIQMALKLADSGHALSLEYNRNTQEWICVDANWLLMPGSHTFHSIASLLVTCIKYSFDDMAGIPHQC